MYNNTTTSVNNTRPVRQSMLTTDTIQRLAMVLKGDRFATIELSDAECSAIEHLAYCANIGRKDEESAWVRFVDLVLNDITNKDISEEIKERLGCAVDSCRYEVRTFDADGDTIVDGLCFSTLEDAKAALLECLANSDRAVRGFVYDADIEDGIIEYTNEVVYNVAHDSPIVFADEFSTAEDAANAISEWLTDSYYGEKAFDDMLDEIYETTTICGYSYFPSVALRRVDPIAYREGLLSWAGHQRDDILDMLQRMDAGDYEEVYGLNVSVELHTALTYEDPAITAASM